MISVVCVYNDRETLEEYLLKSLRAQSVEYELILLDNTKGRFKSAAQALNRGGKRAKGKYIMFVHQDVDLISPRFLAEAEAMLDALHRQGISGVAGKTEECPEVITNILHGASSEPVKGIRLSAPLLAQTVDECLFFIPREVFDRQRFDARACPDWHLYAADFALSVKRLGLNVYILPLKVYHASPGHSFSEKYYVTLAKILVKHRKDYGMIRTTMGDWPTNYPVSKELGKIGRRERMRRHLGPWVDSLLTPLYRWELVSQLPDGRKITLTVGESITLAFTAENKGRMGWYRRGLFPVRVGTTGPRDRRSKFAHSEWLAPDRPAELPQEVVAPGDKVTFSFQVVAPSEPGDYEERFSLVAEGIGWMDESEVRWLIHVKPSTSYRRLLANLQPYNSENPQVT
jgi:hypothetical protein